MGRRRGPMTRGAAAHFSLKRTEFDPYYTLLLGVIQNQGLLVADVDRSEDRALMKALPRSGMVPGVELELRRRTRGVDVHVLVAPHEDFPAQKGRFLMHSRHFAFLHKDAASARTLSEIMPALRRTETQRPLDPHFAATPSHIPNWIFFNIRGGGAMTWFLGTAIGTIGAAYLLFWAPDGPYRYNGYLIGAFLLVLAPWWSGMWARSATRGFVAAFVTVVIPVTLYVIAALGWGLTGLRRDPGVYTIDTFLASLTGSTGMVVPFLLGILAAGVGAIAGIIGGRIFPNRMKHPQSSELI